MPAADRGAATKFPVNHPALMILHCGSMGWWMTRGVGKGGAIAGAVLTLLAAGALLFALDGRSGASAQASLTVDVPPAVTDMIYGAKEARGRPIVVIDAGHGGRDPGATSVSGEVSEKDLTLALARELRDDLVKRGRVRVAMTRADGRYLTLEQRAALARRLDAGMFVSLHMDSAPNPLARGATVYSLSDVASDAEAARVAAKENGGAAAEATGGSVEAMLSDLAMESQMSA